VSRLNLKTILISGVALVVAWVFISKAIVPWIYLPRDTAKSRVNNYESRVDKLEELKVLTENDEHYLAATSRSAFSMDKSEAISRMGVYLTETIKASGLSEDRGDTAHQRWSHANRIHCQRSRPLAKSH